MNCLECAVNINGNCNICKDIFSLLSKLDVPIQEQAILWNMAKNNISCQRFKEILFTLMKRKER